LFWIFISSTILESI